MCHMGGVIFHYHKLLWTFLHNVTTIQNGLRWALKADVCSPYVVKELRVLGLLGKLLMGLWMEVIYANTAKLSNLEISPILHQVMANLEHLKEAPVEFLKRKVDMF